MEVMRVRLVGRLDPGSNKYEPGILFGETYRKLPNLSNLTLLYIANNRSVLSSMESGNLSSMWN